jgi:hypothetical protein
MNPPMPSADGKKPNKLNEISKRILINLSKPLKALNAAINRVFEKGEKPKSEG